MIYIMGIDYEHCRNVALGAGLEPREWTHLHWGNQLMGTQEPNVVVLQAAKHNQAGTELLADLHARSATIWTEMDLINRRVPK